MYKIRLFRKEKGLTLEELAKLSDVKALTIHKLETGKTNYEEVKMGTLIKLALALHCKVADFFEKDLRNIIG